MHLAQGYRWLPSVLALLGLVGLAISLYLTVSHYGKKPIACGGVGECGYVNASEYASVGGVPGSLLRVGLYAPLVARALFWSPPPPRPRRGPGAPPRPPVPPAAHAD